ncbi:MULTISPECIES: ParA family protein [Alteromonas]|jgi:chromosome partitioning protein|uniref:Cobalamin biosynthesis protein CobQ n=1 Tax=Alteromonas gracilis TaxID=1479524 RepID=A0ABX5CRB9_9ALTE|nr:MULTISPECIES: ParA family protein [Alteromonas]PRO69940.1 cobalamin biosynthesis protein CobQ [Alteromonas gracilis]GFD72834.1 cobyric acid synthase [Tenacibaculum sp. KUL113]GFD86325.1 cobyric acid synthase [Alteromonas sp. KUL150]
MKVWTVANQKGGVGKTTTTVSLGGLLAEQGKRVLMIDTDPHASLSYYFGIDAEATSHSVYDIFIQSSSLSADNVMDCLSPTKLDNLYVLPATMALATLDRTMGSEQGMGLVLKKALAKIADEFDVAIIDCPPVLGVLMVNALAACDKVIVPTQTEYLALKGLDRMIRTMEIMGRSLNKTFDTVIIPTMFDKRTNAALASRKKLLSDYGERVWEGVIPVDTHFRDASLVQLPISSAYPKTRGVSAYAKLLAVLEK